MITWGVISLWEQDYNILYFYIIRRCLEQLRSCCTVTWPNQQPVTWHEYCTAIGWSQVTWHVYEFTRSLCLYILQWYAVTSFNQWLVMVTWYEYYWLLCVSRDTVPVLPSVPAHASVSQYSETALPFVRLYTTGDGIFYTTVFDWCYTVGYNVCVCLNSNRIIWKNVATITTYLTVQCTCQVSNLCWSSVKSMLIKHMIHARAWFICFACLTMIYLLHFVYTL